MINHNKKQSLILKYLESRQKISHRLAPYSLLDDRYYVEYKFFQALGYRLNLTNPRTFCEKLQWLKLYDREPLYPKLVDKYLVRDYVSAKIGDQYLNELHGVFENNDAIDWNSLPHQFVLKTTHGSGKNIICHDKSKLTPGEVKQKFNHWLGQNYYTRSREWMYKNIKPRIVWENYIPWDPMLGLLDYKVYCFNGEPRYIDVHYGRFTDHKSIFYDTNWIQQPFGLIHKELELDFLKPRKLSEMLDISQKLSEGIPYCRIDLYYVDEKITFGEITFFPGGGNKDFWPMEYNYILGDMIQLPKKDKNVY